MSLLPALAYTKYSANCVPWLRKDDDMSTRPYQSVVAYKSWDCGACASMRLVVHASCCASNHSAN